MQWESEDTPVIAPAAAIDSTWTLVFDDEFNGTSLNSQHWTPNWLGATGAITPPINSAELAAYDPAQVTVSGGFLNLKAIAKKVTVGGKTYSYVSGCVTSNGKFNQAYGYFETRINSPAASNGLIANWPAFWTDGQNWPTDGEIDIYEGLSGRAAYHYHYSGGGPGATVPGTFTGWHTYAGLWKPGVIEYYYDDVLVGTINQGVVSAPHFMVLNYGVGGYGGPQLIPATMQVDYVRVYSNDPSAVAVPPESGYTPPAGDTTDDIAKLQQDVATLQTQVADHETRLDKISTGAKG